MIWLLASVTVVSLAIGVALQLEFKRIEQRNRMREFLATNPAALRLGRDLEEVARQIGEQFTPVMRRVTTAIAETAPTFDRLAKAMREAELRAANAYRKGGTDR